MRTLPIAALLLMVISGCDQSATLQRPGSDGQAAIVAEVLDRTSEWGEACRRRDAPAVLELFLDSEDLRHVENGVIFPSHAAVAEFVNGWFGSTVEMDFSWEERHIVPLAADVATMTGVFKYEAKQESGEVWSGRNVFTGVFVKRGGTWRLVHGHESSVPPPKPAIAASVGS